MPVPVVDNPSDAHPGAAEAGARRSAWRPDRADLLVFGAYALLGVFVCAGYWADVQHRISSHLPTDHSWFEWLFAHGAYSVRHLSNPLFSTRQNAPDGVNMMANTSMLGVTLPMSPITMLFGPQVSYALYLGLALAATAATAYWVLRRDLVRSRGAAVLGGAFLGFAPGVMHHANGQPNFASNFLLPLIVGQVFRLGTPGRRWRRDGLLLGLLVTYQIFLNEEMLLLTALACVVALAAYAVFRPAVVRSRLVPFALGIGLAGGVTLLLAGYPIWFQFNGPQSYRGLQGGVFHNWGEDLAAFVTYSRDTLAGSPAVEKTIGVTEQNTWLGWPLVVLVLAALVPLCRRSVPARVAAVLIVVFGVASLGPQVRLNARDTGVPGIWHYISDDLPLVEMMMPTRLGLVLVAAVGILLALAWDAVAARPKTDDVTATDATAHSAADTTAHSAAADDAANDDAADAPAAPGRHGGRFARLRPLGYAVILLAVLPLFPRPLPAMPVDPPPHFISAGGWRPYVPDGRTLVPIPLPNNVQGLSTLRWSALTEQEFPIPGGYFIGPGPGGEGIFGVASRPTAGLFYAVADGQPVPVVGAQQRAQAIEDLRYWRASVVVLGPQERQDALLALATALLGPAQRVDDVWLWDVRSRLG
ncbi:hypothetical protein [Plantactinospora sp. KBS50]|uniref:hypothetical protein n=1 Tax=Plantactinospora sp. KBS50 TaxID=2024580 RepID=UPI0012FD1FD4|nr:hypothetical protein [Plantactinospora sp. KBS50]